MSGKGGSSVLVDPETLQRSGCGRVLPRLGYQVLSRPCHHSPGARAALQEADRRFISQAKRKSLGLLRLVGSPLGRRNSLWRNICWSSHPTSTALVILPRVFHSLVPRSPHTGSSTAWTVSWPEPSSGSNLSPGAGLRSRATWTLFELDPGDQIAPNITCYFRTVAGDGTLGPLARRDMWRGWVFLKGQLPSKNTLEMFCLVIYPLSMCPDNVKAFLFIFNIHVYFEFNWFFAQPEGNIVGEQRLLFLLYDKAFIQACDWPTAIPLTAINVWTLEPVITVSD